MKAEKILVVDDNDAVRTVISEMLSRIGCEVFSADSGEHGLSIFMKNKIDIVLSDFRMPGMNGVAFAGRIKKSSPHTPVVIMTAAGQGAVFIENNATVDAVLQKPFSLAKLDQTIQNWSGKALQM